MNDLRTLLDETAPERPEVLHAERMAAVRRRSRTLTQRLRLAIGAALAAVVAAAVAVPLLVGGTSGHVATDPAPPDAEPAPVECPAEPVAVDEATTKAEFPDGATSMRFCPAAGASGDGEPLGGGRPADEVLPTEPVTDDVDALLDRVAAQPAWTFPPECAAIMMTAQPWALVVGYADGSTVTLGGTMRGCAGVTVDGTPVDVETTLAMLAEATPQGGSGG
jgi:hypothetical protein